MNFLTVIENVPYKTIGILALKSYYNKQKEKVRWVIEKELRQGDFSRVDKDDLIAIHFRLCHAAIEGTAKNNLRLMARLICGLNEKNKLTASTFQKYSKILADLSNEEINLLAVLAVHKDDNFPIDRAFEDMKIPFKSEDENKYLDAVSRLSSLLRTGFIITLPPRGMRDIGDIPNKYNTGYHLSPFFRQFLVFFNNWEDIAKWEEEND